MSICNLLRTFSPLAVIALLPLLAGAATGDLMRTTMHMKMQMTGMPAQYAGMLPRTITHQECVASNQQLRDPRQWVRDSDCTVSNVHRSRTEVTAHVVCKRTTADVDVTLLPDGAHGTIHASTTTGQGTRMVSDQTFESRRIGSCDYQPHAKAH